MSRLELIAALRDELRPVTRDVRLIPFWLVSVTLGAAVFFMCWKLFPVRGDLAERLRDWRFLLETALWFCASTVSCLLIHQSSIPLVPISKPARLELLLLATLAVILCLRFVTGPGMAADILGELRLTRRTCGSVVFAAGAFLGVAGLLWTRTRAPTAMEATARWIALAGGTFATFGAQLICPHENSAHIVIWHFAPVLALMGIWTAIGPKALRW